MHGRLKVKTTAEQQAEKEKERNIKLEQYLKGKFFLYSKKKKLEYDADALQAASQLLTANPDVLSFWNFRRNILLSIKKNTDVDSWQKILEDEVGVTEMCLLKNHKSYGAWHHRGWIFLNIPKPPYEEELNLCDEFIQKDERNFHCWDHRRLIVNRSKHCILKELSFTKDLIEKNFSNYSAWHYRSKLLPIIYKPTSESALPIIEEIFLKELEKVVAAVFTDPSDQSPWFFLRWLLKKVDVCPRLIQIGILPPSGCTMDLLLVFSQIVISKKEVHININDEDISSDDIMECENGCILRVSFNSTMEVIHVKVRHSTWFFEQEGIFQVNMLPTFKWISRELASQKHLPEKAKLALSKVMDDCILLDQLDSGNKWVLLTLVDVMSTLSMRYFQQKILSHLDRLREVDPLRKNYYMDIRSKVLCEGCIMKYVEDEAPSLTLTSQGLTCLTSPQYLCSAKIVDLGGNNLRSLLGISCFLNCHELRLDGNILKDLAPIAKLKYLAKLSLNNCGLHSLEQFLPLACNSSLHELLIEHNNFSGFECLDNALKEIMMSLIIIRY